MKLGIFVSGTDTGIGKTVVSSLLVSSLKAYGIRTGYFKPVQTGQDSDTQTVSSLSGIPVDRFQKPVYEFPLPISPHRAAVAAGAEIQLDQVQSIWQSLDERAWVLEGAGGILVPLNSRQSIRDLVKALGLRLLVVSPSRLGTLNHTLLTLEAAERAGIETVGIVIVGDEDPALEEVFKSLTSVPVLTRVPKLPDVSPFTVQEAATRVFSPAILKKIYD